MYLSRIQLNPRRRDARALLASPRKLHGAVLASFPVPPVGERAGDGRVLWRLDVEEHHTLLYVVSPDAPDFAHLAEQAGWPTTQRGEVRPYDALLERLGEGQRWAFRLTANPTRYVVHPHTGKAKRMGHVTVSQQEEWLQQKASEHGFEIVGTEHPGADGGHVVVPELSVTRRATHSFSRPDAKAPVTLTTAQFDGVLRVQDVPRFRETLVTGIGPGKAYGCGLLTVAPLRP